MAADDDRAGSTVSQESETTEALQAGLQLNVNAVHEHRSADLQASSLGDCGVEVIRLLHSAHSYRIDALTTVQWPKACCNH